MTPSSHNGRWSRHFSRIWASAQRFLSAIDGWWTIPNTTSPGEKLQKFIRWVLRSEIIVGLILISPFLRMLRDFPVNWHWSKTNFAKWAFLDQSALPGVGTVLALRLSSS